jgi:glycosyltransferase involved in cell wall biosynthesis
VTSKRLLVLANSFYPDEPGGSPRLAFDLASDLARKGYEVWYLCQTRSSNKSEYVFQDGLHVLRYRLDPVARIDALRVFKHFSAVKRLLAHYLPEPPAIVHGHDLLPYVSAIKFYRGHGRSYYTVHSPAIEELAIAWRAQGPSGYIKLLSGLPLIWYFERFALAASDGIDAESEYTVGRMAHYYGGSAAGRVRVIPGWVDTVRFKPASQSVALQARQRLSWPTDKPVLFALRRLEARMGLDRLLHAIARLRDEGYDFYTAIGGTGSQLTTLMQLGNRLGLQSRLAFMGRISDDDLPGAYNACDASIIPTSQLECFGIIALEAMACGKPVLVTPIGALPEVVGKFEPQWIASSSTPQGLADLIRNYLDGVLPFHDPCSVAEYVEANYRIRLALARSYEWLGLGDS